MEKHFKTIDLIEKIIDEGLRKNETYGGFVNRFLTDNRINIDTILMLYSKYYIKNKHVIDVTGSTNKMDVIVNFIEKNYQDKDKLWAAYYGNNGLVKELVTSYIKDSNVTEEDIEIIYCLKKENIVKCLDTDFNIVGVEFINNVIRREIRKHFRPEGRIGSIKVMKTDDLTNSSPLWISMMLSHSYMLAKAKSKHDDYTDTIEQYSFNQLVNLFRYDFSFYTICVSYFETMNHLSIQEYISIFDQIEKDEFSVETLKKINPLYVLEKVDVETKRKSLKR